MFFALIDNNGSVVTNVNSGSLYVRIGEDGDDTYDKAIDGITSFLAS